MHGLFSKCLAVISVLAFLPSAAFAQFQLPGLDGRFSGDGPPRLSVSAQFKVDVTGKSGVLEVTANVTEGYHIYSITQQEGGPVRTKIELDQSPKVRLTGDFRPDRPPKVHYEEKIWPDLPIEEVYGQVTWSAPIAISPGVDSKSLKITGLVDAQACDEGSCNPVKVPFTARLVAGAPAKSSTPSQPLAASQPTTGRYRAEGSNVTIRGSLDTARAKPGGSARIVLTANPEPGWHVYRLADRDPKTVGQSKPTLIVIRSPPEPQTGGATSSKQPIPGKPYYDGEVTWTVEVPIPDDANGKLAIEGIIGYQACQDEFCQRPLAAEFRGEINLAAPGQSSPLSFTPAVYAQAAQAAAARPETASVPATLDLDNLQLNSAEESQSLAVNLVFGFLGGLILNLMPCVLPVIGLKVMSFVEQSGHSRHQAFMLNLWYSLGLVSVFMILAGMAVVMKLSWGGQFGNAPFNIVLTALVFAMALSLLGVWEIPIPGFVGGSAAHELSSKEGPGGAFIKGVITTILATPCTGPFMATVLGWAVTQPPAVVYAVFFSMGVGMASPYLLIGAFPKLVKWLPKPGAWMVTFKQVMGFVLMGTVVFLLTIINSLNSAMVVPTMALLCGIAAACWWINRTPHSADTGARATAWMGGLGVTALTAYFAFGWLYPDVMLYRYNRKIDAIADTRIAEVLLAMQDQSPDAGERAAPVLPISKAKEHWPAFSVAKLAQLADQQKTVLVDFSADWCSSCKALEAGVLHTEAVEKKIEDNDVVTLYADFTTYPDEIKQVLSQLGSNGVPVIAIFPAGRPNEPIVFRGVYTKKGLLAALDQAGPSQADAKDGAVRTASLRPSP